MKRDPANQHLRQVVDHFAKQKKSAYPGFSAIAINNFDGSLNAVTETRSAGAILESNRPETAGVKITQACRACALVR